MGCGAVSVRSELMALPARHAACIGAFPARLAPQGENYLSQGVKVSFRFVKWDFGLGYERTTSDLNGSGRPTWDLGKTLLGYESIDLSKDGLEASIGGGIFIGASATASTGPMACKVER